MQSVKLMMKIAPITKTGCRNRSFFDILDHLTGIERRELLAHLSGDCDPFRVLPIKRGCGTRDRPVLVPTTQCFRHVGCLCPKPGTFHIQWMVVHMGEPKRCECGYWHELCPTTTICD